LAKFLLINNHTVLFFKEKILLFSNERICHLYIEPHFKSKKYIETVAEEFRKIINKLRSPYIWKKNDNEWKLSCKISVKAYAV